MVDTRGVRAECLAGCAMPKALHRGCGTGQVAVVVFYVCRSVRHRLPGVHQPAELFCLFARRSQIWDTFMESIEPFARHIPYLVGVGNHGALPCSFWLLWQLSVCSAWLRAGQPQALHS